MNSSGNHSGSSDCGVRCDLARGRAGRPGRALRRCTRGASAGGGSGADRTSPKSVTANIESGAAPAGGLTGDWGGLRTRLVEKGVTIASRYQSEVAYNPRGGDRHTGREAGQFDIGTTADLDKLFGLRGGTFKSTATYRRGEDLGAAAGINPLQQVQEIYGRGHTWRLTQFWYE